MPQFQLLPEQMSTGQMISRSLGAGFGESLQKSLETFHRGKAFEKAGLPRELANLDPQIASQLIKQQQKNALIQQIMGGGEQGGQPQPGMQQQTRETASSAQRSSLSPQQRIALSTADQGLGRAAQTEEKLAEGKFQEERKYHTQFSAPIEKRVSERREGSRKLNFALDLARDAIESGEVGRFSPSVLSTLPGLPEPARRAFQTATGAQLETAGKEFLFSNMGRLSAKAQNIFMEQRIGSMFPRVGQSEEANLTTQEILEGESALDKAYLRAFDELSQKDMDQYGYVRKDIDRRVDEILKPFDKEILDRAAFRTREIQESQWNDQKLAKEANKKVSRGTFLTPRMGGELYKKFGDQTLEHAKKLGYSIPTPEEYEIFQMTSREFKNRFE